MTSLAAGLRTTQPTGFRLQALQVAIHTQHVASLWGILLHYRGVVGVFYTFSQQGGGNDFKIFESGKGSLGLLTRKSLNRPGNK